MKVDHQGLKEVIDDDFHIINQMLSHGQQLSISEVIAVFGFFYEFFGGFFGENLRFFWGFLRRI